jgi:hypothetical protein
MFSMQKASLKCFCWKSGFISFRCFLFIVYNITCSLSWRAVSPYMLSMLLYFHPQGIVRRSVSVSPSMSSLHRLMVCLGSAWAPCRWFLLLGHVGVAFIERRLSLLILFFIFHIPVSDFRAIMALLLQFKVILSLCNICMYM